MPYVLKGYKLTFNHEVPFKDVAKASLEKSQNDEVPGVIYEIYQIDAARLDCMESHTVFNRYGQSSFEVDDKDVFFYKSNCTKDGLRPTKLHLQKILNGYKQIGNTGLDFIQKLENTPTIEQMIPRDPPFFFIKNYDALGPLRPLLMWYDKMCVKLFASLILKPSPFERGPN